MLAESVYKGERYISILHQFEMDPCIKHIVDFLENLGYNCKRVELPTLGEYCYILIPPGYPLEGVDTEEQQFDYMLRELEKVGRLLHFDFKEPTPVEKTVGFHYTIDPPTVNLKPVTCSLQSKNAEDK